jgi:hypothetical protein
MWVDQSFPALLHCDMFSISSHYRSYHYYISIVKYPTIIYLTIMFPLYIYNYIYIHDLYTYIIYHYISYITIIYLTICSYIIMKYLHDFSMISPCEIRNRKRFANTAPQAVFGAPTWATAEPHSSPWRRQWAACYPCWLMIFMGISPWHISYTYIYISYILRYLRVRIYIGS